MDKALAGLIGAVGALAAATPGQAAVGQAAPGQAGSNLHEVMRAESYADLLKPIPNAAAVLQASDEAERLAEPHVMEVQYYHHHHHHHHHHHEYYRPRFVRPFFPPRYVQHHHYHHHHHHHHGSLFIIR